MFFKIIIFDCPPGVHNETLIGQSKIFIPVDEGEQQVLPESRARKPSQKAEPVRETVIEHLAGTRVLERPITHLPIEKGPVLPGPFCRHDCGTAGQAARTWLRNFSTSCFRVPDCCDISCAADNTSPAAAPVCSAPWLTCVILASTCWVPLAASCTF